MRLGVIVDVAGDKMVNPVRGGGRGGAGGNSGQRYIANLWKQQQQPTTRSNSNKSNSAPENDNTVKATLDKILSKIDLLSNDIIEVKEQLAEVKVSIRAIIEEEFEARDLKWTEERKEMERRIFDLKRRDEWRSREEKRNNIIIRGFAPVTDNLNDEISNLLLEKLNIQVKVADSSRIKIRKGGDLFKAKFCSSEDKRQIMTNKSRLAGSEISINDDRTVKEREVQRKLSLLAEEERKRGKTVKIGYRKLIVDGVEKRWHEDRGLLEPNSTSPSSQHQPFRRQ